MNMGLRLGSIKHCNSNPGQCGIMRNPQPCRRPAEIGLIGPEAPGSAMIFGIAEAHSGLGGLQHGANLGATFRVGGSCDLLRARTGGPDQRPATIPPVRDQTSFLFTRMRCAGSRSSNPITMPFTTHAMNTSASIFNSARTRVRQRSV